MYQKVEINSFLATKLRDDHSFTKYDIEASIDEVESEEDHVKLKYRFVLLSNPTNVKMSMDGFTLIYGNRQEIARHLSNDERNIPRVVNALYQEIFPYLYITSKTMQIPCPAYKLADISKTDPRGISPMDEQADEKHAMPDPNEGIKSAGTHDDVEKQYGQHTEPQESLIEEQNITTG